MGNSTAHSVHDRLRRREFSGRTTSDLRTALLTGATRPVTPAPRHFVALTLRQYLLRHWATHWSSPAGQPDCTAAHDRELA
ncbi:MAG: hypothetical protein R2851_02055 [Caldilineaceae bacterium]